MSISDLKAIRSNWKPVTLYLADGRKLRVRLQDYLLISPTGEAVFVFSEPDGKSYEILDHELIVSVERRV